MATLPTPRTISYLQHEISQGLTLFGFFPICNIIFPIIDFPNQSFFDFEQHKHPYLIQKESMGTSISEAWNKNIFCFVVKLFFLQSRQIKISSYTSVWYKNV